MKKIVLASLSMLLCFSFTACGSQSQVSATQKENKSEESSMVVSQKTPTDSLTKKATITKNDIKINETRESASDGEHVITADGSAATYSNIEIKKTGDASGDNADFYGDNAALFATNKANLDLSNMVINTNGAHANGVFSYGEGTTVSIKDSVIETSGNCSGGLMTTGGGTMIANNLNIYTTGNSSAAIRSDRGGGIVNVWGGSYITEGKGSPTIYSTADITVNDAYLESTASQGVVVEGKNSVTLNNVELKADNNTKNSNKSEYYQAVMIYQSMSGDAAVGKSTFTMNGGSLVNAKGDIFFVNNTNTEIILQNASLVNNDANGVFLRAAAAGWGKEGSNGGQVTLNATNQIINGNMLVDNVSHLNTLMKEGSTFTGAINPDGQAGEVYVELDSSSRWVLTADSYITSLTCNAGNIDLNGHTLYINGTPYNGQASSGSAIEVKSSSSGSGKPDSAPPRSGERNSSNEPPKKPE